MDRERDKLPPYIKALAGKRVNNRYDIDKLQDGGPDVLGSGTSAYVLKATAPLRIPKAIKVLKKERVLEANVKARFFAEVERLIEVRHPNIVLVEDCGTLPTSDDSGKYQLPYYVMECVDGACIREWAAEREKVQQYLGADAVCWVIRQMVLALIHVHSRKRPIFHLDLKPSNVFITRDGIPKLGDFGLALALPRSPVTEVNPSGREFAAMHPDFREMVFAGVIDPSKLVPQFDLFGLGYTLGQVESYLKHGLDRFRSYIFDAMVLRMTVAEPDSDNVNYPARKSFIAAELDVPEYPQVKDVLEALDKLGNPDYHIANIPELRIEPSTLPPLRIAGGTHVPTTERLRMVLDTPIFQRLQWMKQLDFAHYAYPGAEHTRHEHSLGVYYYTIRYLRRLLREPYFVFHFSCEDVRATLLGALFHDIAHYPTAHAISESQNLGLRSFSSHEGVGKRLLQGKEQDLAGAEDQKELARIVRDEWKVSLEMVSNIAYECIDYTDWKGSTYVARRHNLLHSIIDGPIDADKMHYLQCDSVHTGNPVGGNFDAEQLIDALSFTPKLDGIGVTDKGLAAVESFLYSYYRMHVDVYWHHTVRAARKMVARAIDWYIKEPRGGASQRRDKVKQAIILLTDRDFMTWLATETEPNSPASQLIGHLVKVENKGEFTVVRPVRKMFKRFRTYSAPGRGDPSSKAIFALLSQERDIDMLKCEKEVAQTLSKLVREPIAAWEIIIDIPRSEEGQMDAVSVSFTKVKQQEYAHRLLDEFREIAKRIRESYVEDSRKIRVYCSPRIRLKLVAHEAQLNPCILEAIRKCRGAGH